MTLAATSLVTPFIDSRMHSSLLLGPNHPADDSMERSINSENTAIRNPIVDIPHLPLPLFYESIY